MKLYESITKNLKESNDWKDALEKGKVINVSNKPKNHAPADFKYSDGKLYYRNGPITGNTWLEHPKGIDDIIEHFNRQVNEEGSTITILDDEKGNEVDFNKLIDNDMTIKELDDTAQWLYDYDRNEWDKFTDNELRELANLVGVYGRAYDDEVYDELDRRGISMQESENLKEAEEKDYYQEALDTIVNYITKEYNELGSDDRGFLLSAIKKGKTAKDKIENIVQYVRGSYNEIHGDDAYFILQPIKNIQEKIDKDARRKEREEKQAVKDEKAKQGITGYSSRGKRQDVIDGFKKELEPELTIKEPGGWGDNTIGFRKPDSRVGLRAYLQNKNLPDDTFALSFNNLTANKYVNSLGDIEKLKTGDYEIDLGSGKPPYKFWTFKLVDIPKISQAISGILNSEPQLAESENIEDNKQKFIDYCKDKIKPLGSVKVHTKDLMEDFDEEEDKDRIITATIDIEYKDGSKELGGDKLWDILYEDGARLDSDGTVEIVSEWDGAGALNGAANMDFKYISRKTYNNIIEHWEDWDMSERFENSDTFEESQTQEIEQTIEDLKVKEPNIEKYLKEYYKEIEKLEPRPAYDEEKDQMNPLWEQWNRDYNNVLYSEIAWKNFISWIKDKYGKDLNESEGKDMKLKEEEEKKYGGLFGRVLEIIESNGWSCDIDEEHGEVGIENWSPAGEDLYEYLSYGSNDLSDDEKGENLQNSVRELAENFDADEHVEMLVDMRGQNGVPDSIRTLIEDADDIQGMYNDLWKEVSSISVVKDKEESKNESEEPDMKSYFHGDDFLDNIGSDYELIVALYNALGYDTDEEFFPEKVQEDADNENLYMEDGNIVLNKDGYHLVCYGRDSSNYPIIANITGILDSERPKSVWLYISESELSTSTIPNDIEAQYITNLSNTQTVFSASRKLTLDEMEKFNLKVFDNRYFNQYPEVIKELSSLK